MEALLPLFVVIPLGFAFITVSPHCHPAGFSCARSVIGLDDSQHKRSYSDLYGGQLGAYKRHTNRHSSLC